MCTKLWKKLDGTCLQSILCDWLVRGVFNVLNASDVLMAFKNVLKEPLDTRDSFWVIFYLHKRKPFMREKVVHAASSGSLLIFLMFKSLLKSP